MNIKVLFILSLAANVALGGLYYRQLSKKSDTPAPVVANTAKASQAKPIPSPSAAPGTTVQIVEKAIDWRAVESEDYRKYIANLRSIGCPKETIKDIIVADVNKLFAERRKLIATGGKKFEFWKTGNPLAAMMDPEKIEKQQELAKEKKALLKELLGEDVED
ncbi:MAG TPA: hypothetical protein VK968_05985, partial [Roseimicrobium sp.]|nr:hypothetical protein [Roseimicrobium sp.]